ncbi:MAG: hypothetical protein J4G00_00980 [Actinomycetia bacterium]|nr:hypothetical protein [Actinomycetes bacterium]
MSRQSSLLSSSALCEYPTTVEDTFFRRGLGGSPWNWWTISRTRLPPWFDYYGGDLTALQGAKKLANLDSVTARRIREGRVVRQEGPLGPVLVNPLY